METPEKCSTMGKGGRDLGVRRRTEKQVNANKASPVCTPVLQLGGFGGTNLVLEDLYKSTKLEFLFY